MATIRQSGYDPQRNLFGRPTVSVEGQSTAGAVIETQTQLYDTLDMLVATKPNWRFVGTGSCGGGPAVRVFTDFKIYEDDELLGSVGIEYKGRDYKIKVRNDRIDAARERGNGYHTDDPVKAQLRIRKTFFRRNNDERIEKAVDAASSLLAKEHRDKSWDYRRAKDNLLDKATEFARKNLTDYLEMFPALKPKLEPYTTAKAALGCVNKVKAMFDNKKAFVVAFDGTHYIVKSEDGIKTFSDETLPYEFRGKLGMLKLVQDGQMISDVGCRVDSNTFVLLPEAKEQA